MTALGPHRNRHQTTDWPASVCARAVLKIKKIPQEMEIRPSPEGGNCISSQNIRFNSKSANNHRYMLSERSWFNILNY